MKDLLFSLSRIAGEDATLVPEVSVRYDPVEAVFWFEVAVGAPVEAIEPSTCRVAFPREILTTKHDVDGWIVNVVTACARTAAMDLERRLRDRHEANRAAWAASCGRSDGGCR
ncbi:MAG: hypothetical protein NZL87_04285 [Thermomicrobium sp.]|nr:hypothetical protein [Thermomicrobium sp.]